MAPEDAAARRMEGAAPARAPDVAGAAPRRDLRPVFLAVAAVVLAGWAIKALYPVLMPLTAAVLISLAVMPVRDWVARHVPTPLAWLGVVAAMLTVLLALAIFVGVLILAARQIVAEIPVSPGQVVESIQGSQQTDAALGVAEGAQVGAAGALSGGAPTDAGPALREEATAQAAGDAEDRPEGAEGQGGGLLSGNTVETVRRIGERALGAAGGAAAAALNSVLAVLGSLVLIVFLTLLILSESGDWRRKIRSALPWPEDWRVRESTAVIATKARSYVLSQAALGFVSACLYALWLGWWGIGLLIVWPLLIFVLNFIPTIGSLVGGTLPVAYTLLTRDVQTAVFVGLGILAIENVMGNLVGPRVQGRNLALSPLVVLVALAFWGWAWGIAGALLAVPLTVALVVVGAHVPVLRPWALMLSNKTEWAGLDEATRPE